MSDVEQQLVDRDALASVQVDCWNAENWLTYHGDQSFQVGRLMGPTLAGQPCTVVAAHHDSAHVWPDGRRGLTLLGLVTGDVRAEMGVPVRALYGSTAITLVQQRAGVDR